MSEGRAMALINYRERERMLGAGAVLQWVFHFS
jgi:hypothetical protein